MKQLTRIASRTHTQKGYLLVLVIVTSVALMAIAVALMSVSSTKYAKTNSDGDTASAVYAAEAGISDTLNRLNQSNTFAGYTTKKQFYSSSQKGKADYTTAVTPGADGTLIVTSTGYAYATSGSTTPTSTRTVRAIITKEKTPFVENVLAGAGGLTMSGTYFPWFGQPTAMQKSSVYSRGKIKLNGSSTSIGTVSDSARVMTPNVGCGTTTNFPQQCASNDPPIIFGGGGWFSTGAGKIYGSVCATDQPASVNILPGPTGTGLEPGCIGSDYGIPYLNKEAFTNAQTIPLLPVTASCPLFGAGIPIWLDHARVAGNVTLQGGFLGTCDVTILGDVYIKGDLTIDQGVRIRVADTLGSRKPTIVVNGKITVEPGAQILANTSGSHATFVSFWSTDNTCSTSDTCTTISSTHLYNSSMLDLGSWWYATNRAILMNSGNAPYGTTTNLSGAAFYSYFGSTLYSMTGNQSVRGIGGQEVVINPGGAFSFSGGSLSVTATAPFGHVLQRSKYVVGDYLQVF